jgi:hypothetical protein
VICRNRNLQICRRLTRPNFPDEAASFERALPVLLDESTDMRVA